MHFCRLYWRGIRAFLHVEAVPWFDLSALAAIAEYIAAVARCLESDRLRSIELRFIPVHLGERKNLAREEPLRLFGVLQANGFYSFLLGNMGV